MGRILSPDFLRTTTAGTALAIGLLSLSACAASSNPGEDAIDCALGELPGDASYGELSHAIEVCYGNREPYLNGDTLDGLVREAQQQLGQTD